MSLKKVAAALKRSKRFLITTHVNMEGDALGSELAMYRLLRAMGKQAVIVNDDPVPQEYSFLPGLSQIKRYSEKMKAIAFDCFLALDCSDLSRCGAVARLNTTGKPVINIDHHVSNSRFGDINWVEPDISSACELVYRLFRHLRVPFDKTTATLLYIGILTDTGSFHYSNTGSATHNAVAQLLQYDLSAPRMYRAVYENVPLQDMVLLGKIVSTLQSTAQGRIVWLKLKAGLVRKKMSYDLSEHLLTFMRQIKGIEAAVLFKENLGLKNEVRANFRSQGRVDVNKIAASFGGGGHRTASGATIKGSLDSVARKVIKKIKSSL